MSDEKISVHDWVTKAEMDYEAARDLQRRRKNPLPDKVAYDSAQCAEKYIKAFLVRHNRTFRYRHDLVELKDNCLQVDPDFKMISDDLFFLNRYASEIRYPGVSATQDDARETIVSMKRVRSFVRAKLGLK